MARLMNNVSTLDAEEVRHLSSVGVDGRPFTVWLYGVGVGNRATVSIGPTEVGPWDILVLDVDGEDAGAQISDVRNCYVRFHNVTATDGTSGYIT